MNSWYRTSQKRNAPSGWVILANVAPLGFRALMCCWPHPLPFRLHFFAVSSIGDRVWQDLNANGVQDAGEPGVSGVTVQLLQGSTVIATVTTTSNGSYIFPNVVPGTYTVVFQKPSGYTFTPITNQESKVIDFVTGSTSTITVTSGQTITTIDAGLYQGVSSDCCSDHPKYHGPSHDGQHCICFARQSKN